MQNNSEKTLSVYEIFLSIQGESTYAGYPCIFIRLSGCPIKCSWCDTKYCQKIESGKVLSIQHIVDFTKSLCKKKGKHIKKIPVELTGGEPLAQKNSLILLKELLKIYNTVLLETSGCVSIKGVPFGVNIIMDLKPPSSGVTHKIVWDNLKKLKKGDEIKFVVKNHTDYLWAKDVIIKRSLIEKGLKILISPVFNTIKIDKLAHWILKDRLLVKIQPQLHKFIWKKKSEDPNFYCRF